VEWDFNWRPVDRWSLSFNGDYLDDKFTALNAGVNLPNQDIICRGTVARKWQEDGEKLVELTIWTENGQGKKTTPGKAVVAFK